MSEPCVSTAARPTLDATEPPVTRREILGWCSYDVGDSAFVTVIVTAIYSLYFGTVVVGDAGKADFYWGLSASIAELCVAILAPIAGAIADFSGSRKKFLAGCASMIVFFTVCLHWVGPGMTAWGVALYVLANIGFAGGGLFIDSFLPGISNGSNAGRISGLKWAMGYLGGLLALILCFPLAKSISPNPSPEQLARAQLIPLVVAGFYVLAVIPTFLFLRDRSIKRPLPAGTGYVTMGFKRLKKTFGNLRRYKDLFRLLIAFLVYNDGIVTVITFSARYAKETIGFTASEVVQLFIVMQLIAVVGALSFGYLADRIGQKRSILLSLCLWILATVVAYFAYSKGMFFIVATLAGLGMGSCQSVTRSLVALFTPKENAAEFFGFLGIAGKALAFAGPMMFGILSQTTGSQRPAILAVASFFIVGMLLLLAVDEQRGKAAAAIPVDQD